MTTLRLMWKLDSARERGGLPREEIYAAGSFGTAAALDTLLRNELAAYDTRSGMIYPAVDYSDMSLLDVMRLNAGLGLKDKTIESVLGEMPLPKLFSMMEYYSALPKDDNPETRRRLAEIWKRIREDEKENGKRVKKPVCRLPTMNEDMHAR